ncbi:hypothetical protein Tco_0802859 [Tanacetum coccineum]|uniref:Retrotransposon gag domain-containing protein n=1 Tax=Tanacetum coccineum TaxID=301880 RepID=A0ABQ5A2G9_9ASTR
MFIMSSCLSCQELRITLEERPITEQFDAVTSQIATLTLEIQTAKVSRWTRHEAGSSDQWIPLSMRLDVPKFNGSDPDTWILAINEYFSLLEMTPEQRLRIIGLIMEGDATDWYRWMTHNKLTSWEDFLESVRSRFGPSKYDDPQGRVDMVWLYIRGFNG